MRITPLNQILGSSYAPIICISIIIHIIEQKGYQIRDLLNIKKIYFKKFFYIFKWYILCILCILCFIYLVIRRGALPFVCLCIALPIFILVKNRKIFFLENKIVQFY